MTLSRRNFLRTTAIGGAALAAPSLIGSMAQAADGPIRIGSLLDLAGPLAATGEPMAYATELAVEELNNAGGLLGRELELVSYDTQSSIQLYSQFAQQLAVRDKVDVIHGGITSASREAIRPIFDRFRTLYFYNTLYEGGVCDRNTFNTGTTPAQTVEKLVPYAMNLWGKKVYIIAADYNYGQITAKWMKKYVQDNGGEVLSIDFFPLDVTNFGPSISRIQAAKPDLLLSAMVGGNHTAFYRQWAAAGLKGEIPIASTTFGLVNEPATLEAAESNGVLGSYGYFEELQTPASLAFVKAIKDKHGAQTPYISELAAASYEGVHLWAEGVKKAGTVDRIPVIEALETGISFDGPSGKVVIDPKTHHVTRNAFLAEVEDKSWKVLETFEQQAPLDTAAVCDLEANPTDTTQYEIDI
ncbi:ABC transporter substrate-binding protein [Puniceibacterium sediminis]|uniref:Amino acid/amide ABC transporter substrate-binding protein, HAAT family n=1 Tax=Puniceibacterium sediminis TaxID=1608407 RepID=A0A238VFT7_9RHOB|nr:ABC transporter substrate-binding protein [Puniceibacterium sediminis]SNR33255.1 amino acid/amide ABC transporter substrate-binding protein, HAAT family [Puniceibacterium sediminis]